MGDIRAALRIEPCKRTIAQVCAAHGRHIGIDDTRIQPGLKRHGIKGGVNYLPVWQAEGNIGHAEHRFHAQFPLDQAHRLKRCVRRLCIRADGHSQSVNDDIFFFNPILLRFRYDPPCNLKPTFRRGRNAGFIERQRDDHAAVFLRQGKNLVHHLLLPADGVHHRLAVIEAQGVLHHHRIGSVDLERKRRHALKRLHGPAHHRPLVNTGQADVNIQNMRAARLLLNRLRKHIIHIVFPQGLLKTLFSRWVDALADDNGGRADLADFRIRGYDCFALSCDRHRRKRFTTGNHFTNIGRRCTAATAEHAGSHLCHLLHLTGKFIRQHIIHRLPIPHSGHAGIGVENDGGKRR